MKIILLAALTCFSSVIKADDITNYLLCSEYEYHLGYLKNDILPLINEDVQKLNDLKTLKEKCSFLSVALDPIESKVYENALEATILAKYFNICSNVDNQTKADFNATASTINKQASILIDFRYNNCK